MKTVNYFSDDVKAILQGLYPDIPQLFDDKLKGQLITYFTPCEQKIPFCWVFILTDVKEIDHIIYEHGSGRAYPCKGTLSELQTLPGDKYENEKFILEACEKDSELYVALKPK